jgi:hypothetical protein
MIVSNAQSNGEKVFDEPMLKAHMLVAGGSTCGPRRLHALPRRAKRITSLLIFFTAVAWTAAVLVINALDTAPRSIPG